MLYALWNAIVSVPRQQAAYALAGAGGINIYGDLNVSANDPDQLRKQIVRQARRSTVRRGSHGAAP